MMKRKLLMLSCATIAMSGCLNHAQLEQKASGAQKGELPTFSEEGLQTAQQEFRSKRSIFRNTGKMPEDTTEFTDCNLTQDNIQELSGYNKVIGSTKPIEGENDKQSLAAEIGNAAGSAGNSISADQSYQWNSGSVLARPEVCSQLANNSQSAPLSYLYNSSYTKKVIVGSNTTSYTTITQGYITTKPDNSVTETQIVSTKIGGAGLMKRAVINLNDLEDPMFLYTYRKGTTELSISEVALSPGIFYSRVSTDMGNGKKRGYLYAGKEKTRITRTLNDRPHGLQQDLKYGSGDICFRYGEVVQTSNCETF